MTPWQRFLRSFGLYEPESESDRMAAWRRAYETVLVERDALLEIASSHEPKPPIDQPQVSVPFLNWTYSDTFLENWKTILGQCEFAFDKKDEFRIDWVECAITVPAVPFNSRWGRKAYKKKYDDNEWPYRDGHYVGHGPTVRKSGTKKQLVSELETWMHDTFWWDHKDLEGPFPLHAEIKRVGRKGPPKVHVMHVVQPVTRVVEIPRPLTQDEIAALVEVEILARAAAKWNSADKKSDEGEKA